jgi:hypothetical protein
MRPPILLLALATLPACAGSGAGYPSLAPRQAELPRDIAAPGENTVPALAPEQQQGLRADVLRERAALDQAEAEIRETGSALDREVAAARGSKPGAESWSNAQMALSRFELARAPLGDIRARLAPLERIVDSLPPADADRQAVQSLAARAAASAESAQRQVDAATRALGG